MPRRSEVQKRELAPDPKYGLNLVTRFISCLMHDGKRSLAEMILYDAIDIIGAKSQEKPIEVFEHAVRNVEPMLEVKSRRVGGSTYQVPVEVRSDRRITLAIRWIISFARKRSEKTMQERLAAELLEAATGRGNSIKKKEDTLKMAEANKAFAHFRW